MTVAAPRPTSAAAAEACRRLVAGLPRHLEGRPAAPVRPRSPYVAAWGDPALVLRCGVPRPGGLTATSQLVEVDGVDWFLHETRAAYVFTTVGRVAGVQVQVPTSVPREEATAPLVDLARPVRAADQQGGPTALPLPGS